mgnify:CR=1 FL=1
MKLLNRKQSTIKGIAIGTILGGLIFGSIGVAAVTLTANQIKYTPNNEKFNATNAKEALDEIYKIAEYEIPENTYFYEEGTEGDSETIVRYKKINDEYFVCDEYGKVEEGTSAVDITSKTLIPYTATSANNLSAGNAGFASGSLILGDSEFNKKIMHKETITASNSYKTYNLTYPLSEINGLIVFRNSRNACVALYIKQISETKWFSGYGSSLHNLDAYDGGSVYRFNITENQFQFFVAADSESYTVYYF